MASISQSVPVSRSESVFGRNGMADRYFYFLMSLLSAALVVWGFRHTVDRKLFHPSVAPPAILWLHGAAFSAWMLFFIMQSALARTRNLKLHRTLGWFGAALGGFMVPLGVETAIVMGRFDMHVLHQPSIYEFFIFPLYDMLVFALLFGLAVLWRKKAPLHRRLIFVATCTLLSAAFGRTLGREYMFPLVDAVILIGVLHDLLINRHVHKVYLLSLPILMFTQAFVIRVGLSGAVWWVKIARSIIG